MNEPLRRSPAQAARHARLADECAAFLSGDYLEYMNSVSDPGKVHRSAWMVLNPVAHGSAERVRSIASAGLATKQQGMGWNECRAVIATALLDESGDDDGDLGRLQRDALIPLELALIGDVGVTPQMLVQLSLLALEVQTFSDGG